MALAAGGARHRRRWGSQQLQPRRRRPTRNPDAGIPATFQLSPNYPNPFNPATTIRFGLPVASAVTVTIYNVLGQRMATLAEGRFQAGWHAVQWNAQDAGSGVYFYRIEAGAFREARTMLLLK